MFVCVVVVVWKNIDQYIYFASSTITGSWLEHRHWWSWAASGDGSKPWSYKWYCRILYNLYWLLMDTSYQLSRNFISIFSANTPAFDRCSKWNCGEITSIFALWGSRRKSPGGWKSKVTSRHCNFFSVENIGGISLIIPFNYTQTLNVQFHSIFTYICHKKLVAKCR